MSPQPSPISQSTGSTSLTSPRSSLPLLVFFFQRRLRLIDLPLIPARRNKISAQPVPPRVLCFLRAFRYPLLPPIGLSIATSREDFRPRPIHASTLLQTPLSGSLSSVPLIAKLTTLIAQMEDFLSDRLAPTFRPPFPGPPGIRRLAGDTTLPSLRTSFPHVSHLNPRFSTCADTRI